MNSNRTVVRPEKQGSVNGVSGRFHNAIAWPDGNCIANQQWVSESRPIKGYGNGAMMRVAIRHDDNCKNGHETFSITADVTTPASKRRNDIEAGGCMHDEIAMVFPELDSLIKWHLCSTDGPMHYVANTVYDASDRDCHDLLKGEKRQLRNGKTGELSWCLMAVDAFDNEVELYKLDKYANGDQPTCQYKLEYRPWCRVGEGKERQFDLARSSAIWPEATDEQLSLPKNELTALLVARLPALLAEFRQAIEQCGFLFTMPE